MTDSGRLIRPFAKVNARITHLIIVDIDGTPLPERFQLQEGANEFKCRARYADGPEDWYEPYWTCPVPLKSGGADPWRVLGTHRRASATIHASARHERYTELACWVYTPGLERRENVSHGIAFDYSLIA
ncbi:hypothetical protein [Glycomyces tarimensis]